ncbi:hypothetical protein ACFYXS_10045 [Streptomyces sp. NPDC002574]|uniref:hypothetical protein n=1 Tax=Streptomyces sp. NPDC002574 TaxID=3364652 RepID=UPI0036975475
MRPDACTRRPTRRGMWCAAVLVALFALLHAALTPAGAHAASPGTGRCAAPACAPLRALAVPADSGHHGGGPGSCRVGAPHSRYGHAVRDFATAVTHDDRARAAAPDGGACRAATAAAQPPNAPSAPPVPRC